MERIHIAAFPIHRIENQNTFPRYFAAELRIGVSKNSTEVRNCYNDNQSYRINRKTERNIGGMTFQRFEISDAAMMQYLQGESYRAIVNDSCLAIEKLKTGSSYQDTPSPKDIPQSVLDGYYNSVDEIINTIRFKN